MIEQTNDKFWENAQAKFYSQTLIEARKANSQYFTPTIIAKAMMGLLKQYNPKTLLDPSIGHGILAGFTSEVPSIEKIVGLDIDKFLVKFAKENLKDLSAQIEVLKEDFLNYETDLKFDAVICNPPYSIYKSNPVPPETLKEFSSFIGERLAPTTNIYNIFYLKSLQLLSENGIAVFIIPSEFFGTDYGISLKKYFLREKVLRSIYFFDHDIALFEGAITSSCICVFSKNKNEKIQFGRAVLNKDELDLSACKEIEISNLSAEEKWYNLIHDFKEIQGTELGNFCRVSRGIATGDNDFFIFNKTKIKESGIPIKYFRPIVTKSLQISSDTVSFTKAHFEKLVEQDEKIYLLDIDEQALIESPEVQNYISYGELLGVHLKYLPSKRKPWFKAEKAKIPDFFIGTFSRGEVKFVLNEAGVDHLTCFHGGYLKEKSYNIKPASIVDFFNSSSGQEALNRNVRKLGSGLSKLEPRDVEKAKFVLQ